MKRTAFLTSTTTLTRKTPLARGDASLARTRMKRGKGASAKRRDAETRVDAWGNVWTGAKYLQAVRLLHCCMCGGLPCEPHHCTHDRHSSGRRSHFETIPLCRRCHDELHAGKETWRRLHGPDHARIADVQWNLLEK